MPYTKPIEIFHELIKERTEAVLLETLYRILTNKTLIRDKEVRFEIANVVGDHFPRTNNVHAIYLLLRLIELAEDANERTHILTNMERILSDEFIDAIKHIRDLAKDPETKFGELLSVTARYLVKEPLDKINLFTLALRKELEFLVKNPLFHHYFSWEKKTVDATESQINRFNRILSNIKYIMRELCSLLNAEDLMEKINGLLETFVMEGVDNEGKKFLLLPPPYYKNPPTTLFVPLITTSAFFEMKITHGKHGLTEEVKEVISTPNVSEKEYFSTPIHRTYCFFTELMGLLYLMYARVPDLKALVRMLELLARSEERYIRRWATWLIGEIFMGTKKEITLNILRELLGDKDKIVQLHALEALGKIFAYSNNLTALKMIIDFYKPRKRLSRFGEKIISIIIHNPDAEHLEKILRMIDKIEPELHDLILDLFYAIFKNTRNLRAAKLLRIKFIKYMHHPKVNKVIHDVLKTEDTK